MMRLSLVLALPIENAAAAACATTTYYQDTDAEMEPYFLSVIEAVDRVHQNAPLREFWRTGELVANRTRQHPYQVKVPLEYQRVDRWFLLDTSLDPPRFRTQRSRHSRP